MPYLVCTLSAPVTEKGFPKLLMFTDLLEDASANLSHRFICKDSARVNIPSHYKERREALITRYSYRSCVNFSK